MYYNVLKTIKYRKKYSLVLKKKWFLNSILKNHFFFYSIYKYNLSKNNISISKIRNRCIVNGKSRGVFSKFRLSRFYLKHYSRSGSLNGIIKK